MTNKKEDIFQQIENLINQSQDNENQKVQLEVAIQMDTDQTGHQTVYPGIQLNIPSLDMPIFLAVGELRELADAAEEYIKKIREGKYTQEPNPKTKKTKVG